jgi:hypothetical protein
MEKKIVLILIGMLLLGTSPLLAGETAKKEGFWKQAGAIEGRGLVNFLSMPLEFRKAAVIETQDHPKAWPLTYVPRLFTNLATRLTSSVNDFLVLPLSSMATQDTTPLTRRFDMPDYAWQKE